MGSGGNKVDEYPQTTNTSANQQNGFEEDIEDEEEDKYEVLVGRTGCKTENEDLLICHADTGDWRKSQKSSTLLSFTKHSLKMASESSYTVFVDYYPKIEDDFRSELTKYEATPEMIERILQGFFLVADDIMDDSPLRRGKPSWFKSDGIGMIAINDSFIIESLIYSLIKKHFRSTDYYIELVEFFHKVTFQTELGQMVDLTTAPETVDLDKFSIEKHTYIVKYKTSFYSFFMPVALSFFVCGMKDKSATFDIAESILVPMGIYFQVQDDYLDLFGDVALTGKVGTDIEDNKCSWLVIKALEICSPEQKLILSENYGCKSPSNVEKVKQIYNELNIESVFKQYSAKTEQNLRKKIDEVDSAVVNSKVFTEFLDKISNRKK
ncbi:hypothetical protein BB560_001543 [Smittium megazygosporum]|uniref:Farnesyl pyrophosphate synthase n=1 Tax=Smittium megazygosporum TaxID=133381 RepID=A0A2T9ZHB4_9FUNG|nr:hypothetical protein BB560_001543 [Smittium megazygosporum]